MIETELRLLIKLESLKHLNKIGNFYDFRNLTFEQKRIGISNFKTGDILFFHTQSLDENTPTSTNHYPGHLALYIGNNAFIHAKASSGKVLIETFENEKYLEILIG